MGARIKNQFARGTGCIVKAAGMVPLGTRRYSKLFHDAFSHHPCTALLYDAERRDAAAPNLSIPLNPATCAAGN